MGLKEIVIGDHLSLTQYGSVIEKNSVKICDKILDATKQSNVEMIAGKLTDIVIAAKGLDMKTMDHHHGLLNKILSSFSNNKEKFVAQFDTVSSQIEKISHELESSKNSLIDRVKTLEELYKSNEQEHNDLQILMVGCKEKLVEIQNQIDHFEVDNDPLKAQQLNDLNSFKSAIEIKYSDFERLQQSMVMNAPQIRILQHNCTVLIDKIGTTISLTIPAWKKQFALAIVIQEQRNSTDSIKKIDDATNEFMKNNATMLKQVSVDITTQQQRGVIDITTLEFVNTELISTFQEIVRITKKGAEDREVVSKKIIELRDNFVRGVKAC